MDQVGYAKIATRAPRRPPAWTGPWPGPRSWAEVRGSWFVVCGLGLGLGWAWLGMAWIGLDWDWAWAQNPYLFTPNPFGFQSIGLPTNYIFINI